MSITHRNQEDASTGTSPCRWPRRLCKHPGISNRIRSRIRYWERWTWCPKRADRGILRRILGFRPVRRRVCHLCIYIGPSTQDWLANRLTQIAREWRKVTRGGAGAATKQAKEQATGSCLTSGSHKIQSISTSQNIQYVRRLKTRIANSGYQTSQRRGRGKTWVCSQPSNKTK